MKKGITYAMASRRIKRAEAALAEARFACEKIKRLKSQQKKIRKKLTTSERIKSLGSSIELFMNNQNKIKKLEQEGKEHMRLAKQCLLPPEKVNLRMLSAQQTQNMGRDKPPLHPSYLSAGT